MKAVMKMRNLYEKRKRQSEMYCQRIFRVSMTEHKSDMELRLESLQDYNPTSDMKIEGVSLADLEELIACNIGNVRKKIMSEENTYDYWGVGNSLSGLVFNRKMTEHQYNILIKVAKFYKELKRPVVA